MNSSRFLDEGRLSQFWPQSQANRKTSWKTNENVRQKNRSDDPSPIVSPGMFELRSWTLRSTGSVRLNEKFIGTECSVNDWARISDKPPNKMRSSVLSSRISSTETIYGDPAYKSLVNPFPGRHQPNTDAFQTCLILISTNLIPTQVKLAFEERISVVSPAGETTFTRRFDFLHLFLDFYASRPWV